MLFREFEGLKVFHIAPVTGLQFFEVTDYSNAWGTLTVGEYGNSIPFTLKVDSLFQFDLERIVKEVLANDAAKVIDSIIERQFNNCLLRAVGSGTATTVNTTNGTAAATCTSAFNTYHVRKMIAKLKKRNVPGLPNAGGDYAGICSLEAVEQLFADFESAAAASESGYQMMPNGEVTKYYGCRIVEDTFRPRGS